MSISVAVHLLSGKRAFVEVEADELVESLKHRAQSALVAGRGRLLHSSGEVLDGTKTITEAKLKSGDMLSLHVSQVQLTATRQGGMFPGLAFAALLGDRSVVAWGAPDFGGDCSAVQGQLKNVQQIQASGRASAAILANGSVVTWGSADFGGDSRAVQEQLRDVQQIQACFGAFAAILGDGSVVTWGHDAYGGDSRAVQEQLRDVQQIQACFGAFAAIRSDGSVVTWGDADRGGDSSEVQDQLRDVQQIQASCGAFAAIRFHLPVETDPTEVCNLSGLGGEKAEFSAVRWAPLDEAVAGVWEAKAPAYRYLQERAQSIIQSFLSKDA
ncbi:hypothetical protein AK812_SmicGene1245 [Symbiodinium microadriaticum]|uniref:Ubiquitin-like domain-containing protein n=1 Tax=Symbiodinium microadriaticum TaxID=2951 RepID=A0A1Q9F4K1_SYMMI|nr:hypothetical protein AK812_SmicGene1245 [Symbiodinium microadriaticum]